MKIAYFVGIAGVIQQVAAAAAAVLDDDLGDVTLKGKPVEQKGHPGASPNRRVSFSLRATKQHGRRRVQQITITPSLQCSTSFCTEEPGRVCYVQEKKFFIEGEAGFTDDVWQWFQDCVIDHYQCESVRDASFTYGNPAIRVNGQGLVVFSGNGVAGGTISYRCGSDDTTNTVLQIALEIRDAGLFAITPSGCDDGYEIDPATTNCVDVNECQVLAPCDSFANTECVNQEGTYACVCADGFDGPGAGEICCDSSVEYYSFKTGSCVPFPPCPVDDDGDGFNNDVDCNDADPSIYPGAAEVCGDGIDQDCDGSDEACPDSDGDGFASDVDCNDADPLIYPGAPEICGDGIDQDCDGSDEACPAVDNDGDGFTDDVDCDDSDASIYPGAAEICGDGIDQNCDGMDDTCGVGRPNCPVIDQVGLLGNGVTRESCLAHLKAGFTQSGEYSIQPNGLAAAVNIYCDQETRGGGWALFNHGNFNNCPEVARSNATSLLDVYGFVEPTLYTALRDGMTEGMLFQDGSTESCRIGRIVKADLQNGCITPCSFDDIRGAPIRGNPSRRTFFNRENSGCGVVGGDYCWVNTCTVYAYCSNSPWAEYGWPSAAAFLDGADLFYFLK